MIDRSDFQASALYYAGGTYLASALVGGDAVNVNELASTAQQWLPSSVTMALQGDTLQERISNVVDHGMEFLVQAGWAVGALGAALLRRLQLIGLAVLAAVSGNSLNEASLAEISATSMEKAATILQMATFGISSLGLASLMKDGAGRLMPGRRGLSRSV